MGLSDLENCLHLRASSPAVRAGAAGGLKGLSGPSFILQTRKLRFREARDRARLSSWSEAELEGGRLESARGRVPDRAEGMDGA